MNSRRDTIDSIKNGEVAGRAGLDGSAQKVLRNTYMLLSMTLLFSAVVAGVSMLFNLPSPGLLLSLGGYLGLLFLVHKFKDRSAGVFLVFALTGFMGYTLGPIVSSALSAPGGQAIVLQALAGTAITFLGLSAYAVKSRKDFSFLGGFLFAGMIVLVLAALAAVFLDSPGLSVAVSAASILFMSAYILFETSSIVRGGETNYVLATTSLFVSIYNLFISLLNVLTSFSGDDR